MAVLVPKHLRIEAVAADENVAAGSATVATGAIAPVAEENAGSAAVACIAGATSGVRRRDGDGVNAAGAYA